MLKYRKGFPTKKSMREFLKEFDSDFDYVGFGHGWGFESYDYCNLIWQRNFVQDKMDSFIDYASAKGVVFGEYSPYDPPTVGHLQILKKE